MSNAFTDFRTLVGSQRIEVVEITVLNGDGTSQATTLSGQTVTVKGETVAVGNMAFVRDSEIIRQAPDHTVTEVTV